MALFIIKTVLAAFEACKNKQKQWLHCRTESFTTELNGQSVRLIPYKPSHLPVCKTTIFEFVVNSSLSYTCFLYWQSCCLLLAVISWKRSNSIKSCSFQRSRANRKQTVHSILDVRRYETYRYLFFFPCATCSAYLYSIACCAFLWIRFRFASVLF